MRVVLATVYDMSRIPFRVIGWRSFPSEWLLREEFDLAHRTWRVSATFHEGRDVWTVYAKPV